MISVVWLFAAAWRGSGGRSACGSRSGADSLSVRSFSSRSRSTASASYWNVSDSVSGSGRFAAFEMIISSAASR